MSQKPYNTPAWLDKGFARDFQRALSEGHPMRAEDLCRSLQVIREGKMVNYISGLIFVGLLLPGALLIIPMARVNTGLSVLLGILWVIGAKILSSSAQLAAQWERAIVFRLGKYKGMKGPGLFFIVPLLEEIRMVDTRVLAEDIPKQQVITKDNVPVSINGVLFFRVTRPEDAIIKVQDYRYAISQYAQTSLRDVIGQMTLDQLLVEREAIAKSIEANVEQDTQEWGLEVTGLRIQDIDMPEDLKKMMSRQASAEREKRANITKAEGDKEAALNLATAARTMRESPGAMQLRTLQTVDGLGPTASNTVVLAVPIEILETITTIGEALKNDQKLALSLGREPATPASGNGDKVGG